MKKFIENFQDLVLAMRDRDESLREFLNLKEFNYPELESAILSKLTVLEDFGFAKRFSVSVAEIENLLSEIIAQNDFENYHNGI